MNKAVSVPSFPKPLPLLGWRRLRVVLIVCVAVGMIWLPIFQSSWVLLLFRLLFVGFVQLVIYGLFERWPQRLPLWLARWLLQVAAVAIIVPFAAAFIYSITTLSTPAVWSLDEKKMLGFGLLTAAGLLVSPWVAMSALYRQINGHAQRQALSFELERSEFARDALDSRLRLLQAQVEPHFLFNTLANVRELVDSGSPQASTVLNSLIAYLRAAVPNLSNASSTLGQELALVRAYLELMHMRMPDRMQFSINVDDAALTIHCPSMTLLTLVENAVRHGIDPSEEGGQIDVTVRLKDGRCMAQVSDTGVGLAYDGQGNQGSKGLGTGLTNLRERMQLVFSGDAQLSLTARIPHGFNAELNFPAQFESLLSGTTS